MSKISAIHAKNYIENTLKIFIHVFVLLVEATDSIYFSLMVI